MARANNRRTATVRAALEEVAEQPRAVHTVRFFEATYTLPERLPGSLLWDFSDMESNGAGGTMRVLESCLGREQYMNARQQVLDHEVAFDRVENAIGELLRDIFAIYGVELGG